MGAIMIEVGENLTELDEYRKVETAFWEGQDRSGDLGTSQRTRVLELLVPKLRKVSLAEGFTANDFGDRLLDAEQSVDDIAYALCAFWEQKERRSGLGPAHKSGMIWYKPGISCLNSKPDDWEGASPVDKDSLDEATAEYLGRPWMQLNALDWCILNGYIFDETARMGDGIKSGQAVGIINWPYVLAGGDFEKTLYYGVVSAAAKFIGRWILAPAAIATLYYFGYETAALWIAAPYGIYIAAHLALFPMRYRKRKTLRKEYRDWQEKHKKLVNIYQSVSTKVFNPTRLRELIARTENEEVFFRPAVYSILDRAIQRDPAVFTVQGIR